MVSDCITLRPERESQRLGFGCRGAIPMGARLELRGGVRAWRPEASDSASPDQLVLSIAAASKPIAAGSPSTAENQACRAKGGGGCRSRFLTVGHVVHRFLHQTERRLAGRGCRNLRRFAHPPEGFEILEARVQALSISRVHRIVIRLINRTVWRAARSILSRSSEAPDASPA